MTSRTRLMSYVAMAALTVTAAIAIPAVAQPQRIPFKGTIQGQDSDIGFTSPGMFLVKTTGTGTGILLGRFTFTMDTTIDDAHLTDTGTAHFEAANGDTLDATYTSVIPAEVMQTPDGVVFNIKELFTITGGTGRFAGAQGTFLVERTADPQKFVTFGSFTGSITPPGAAH